MTPEDGERSKVSAADANPPVETSPASVAAPQTEPPTKSAPTGKMASGAPLTGAGAAIPRIAQATTPALEAETSPLSPRDEFDPMGWEVPVICKDCEKGFEVPYRHFQVGVVFHCPHCHGSFVPKMIMHQAVRATFESFYKRRKREREEFARGGGDEAAFGHKQEREMEGFRKALNKLAHEMRPAGKVVKRGWLAAMFT
jgi:hypothetical protein